MQKTLSNEKTGPKTYLIALLNAIDPETGDKLTLSQTVASSNGLMFQKIFMELNSLVSRLLIQRQHH
jgi:hypothetical protein